MTHLRPSLRLELESMLANASNHTIDASVAAHVAGIAGVGLLVCALAALRVKMLRMPLFFVCGAAAALIGCLATSITMHHQQYPLAMSAAFLVVGLLTACSVAAFASSW